MSFNNFGNQFGSNFGNQFNKDIQKIRRSPLAITLIVLAIAGAVLVGISSFYADLLWFKSVGYTSVWRTTLFTKAWLFVVVGLITALTIVANIVIAYRGRPIYAPMAIEADNLERYRSQIEPKRRVFLAAIFLVLFYIAGSSDITVNGNATIRAAGDVGVLASNIDITATGNISMDAGGNVVITGSRIDLNP